MAKSAAEVFRLWVTDLVPASPKHKIDRQDQLDFMVGLEALVSSGVLSSGKWKETRALLYADLDAEADSIGVVWGDPTEAFNGYYTKNGEPDEGNWTQRTPFLPGFQFIFATVFGGSANALEASTSFPVADRAALVIFEVPADNTASPVTIEFNGGAALTIKTAGGVDVPIRGLRAGAILHGYKAGSTFQLLSSVEIDVITATVTGGPNSAMLATTNAAIPGADRLALIAFKVPTANSGSPVTIAFNGDAPLTIKTASGNNVPIGGLLTDMVVQGYKVGNNLQLTTDLPGYQFVVAEVVGGTNSAFLANTFLALPDADRVAFIAFEVVADNTASPVTVAFNGGSPLPIKTAAGSDIPIGGLTAGMVVAGYKSGGQFRLLTELNTSIINATVTGGPNTAMLATTNFPIPATDRLGLVVFEVPTANSGSPVTIAFNGASPLTIKTASGVDVPINGLGTGMVVQGYKTGVTFQLLTDISGAAIQAAALADRILAQAAASDAADSADAAQSVSTEFPRPATIGGLKALDTSINTNAFLTDPVRRGLWVFEAIDGTNRVKNDPEETGYAKADDTDLVDGVWVNHDAFTPDTLPTGRPMTHKQRFEAEVVAKNFGINGTGVSRLSGDEFNTLAAVQDAFPLLDAEGLITDLNDEMDFLALQEGFWASQQDSRLPVFNIGYALAMVNRGLKFVGNNAGIAVIGVNQAPLMQGSTPPPTTILYTGEPVTPEEAIIHSQSTFTKFGFFAIRNRGNVKCGMRLDRVAPQGGGRNDLEAISFLQANDDVPYFDPVINPINSKACMLRFTHTDYQKLRMCQFVGGSLVHVMFDAANVVNGSTKVEFESCLHHATVDAGANVVKAIKVKDTSLEVLHLTDPAYICENGPSLVGIDLMEIDDGIAGLNHHISSLMITAPEFDYQSASGAGRLGKLVNVRSGLIIGGQSQTAGTVGTLVDLYNSIVGCMGHNPNSINGPLFTTHDLTSLALDLGGNKLEAVGGGFVNANTAGGVIAATIGANTYIIGQRGGNSSKHTTFEVRLTNTSNINIVIALPNASPYGYMVPGQIFTVDIVNAAGEPIGFIDWEPTQFKLAGPLPNPADGFTRSITFTWNGTFAKEKSRTHADVPN